MDKTYPSKLDKKIKKLLKSIALLQKRKKPAKPKHKRKVKSSKKKNIQAEFATQQLLTQLRNAAAASGGGGASSIVAHDAKRKIEEMQEEGRRSEKDKLKQSIADLEHKADESHRGLSGLQNFALQFQQQMAQQHHAPRGFTWAIEEDDAPESKEAVEGLKRLEHQVHQQEAILQEKAQQGEDVEDELQKANVMKQELEARKADQYRRMVATRAKNKADKQAAAAQMLREAEEKRQVDSELNRLALIEAQHKADAARHNADAAHQNFLNRSQRKRHRELRKHLAEQSADENVGNLNFSNDDDESPTFLDNEIIAAPRKNTPSRIPMPAAAVAGANGKPGRKNKK
jgi:hypothetical protein